MLSGLVSGTTVPSDSVILKHSEDNSAYLYEPMQAPRQPLQFSTKSCVNSAKTKVPTPDPQTEIPVAKDRFASK